MPPARGGRRHSWDLTEKIMFRLNYEKGLGHCSPISKWPAQQLPWQAGLWCTDIGPTDLHLKRSIMGKLYGTDSTPKRDRIVAPGRALKRRQGGHCQAGKTKKASWREKSLNSP